jgi:hypothetical protein
MIRKSSMIFVITLILSVICMANPYDDGLNFAGCPPVKTNLKLPEFPESFKGNCKFLRWARNLPFAEAEKMMRVEIIKFQKDPANCGVYNGTVRFFDAATGAEWYRGELKFYYTRHYSHDMPPPLTHFVPTKNLAFRFVVKGDIYRVTDNIPPVFIILCTKQQNEVPRYDKIFVYGGLDLFFDLEAKDMKGFMLNLGHNDGWYTHHPNCSKRPINWTGAGDYFGHYCERGWLFVSPGRNFVFDAAITPPTGRFVDEAFREVGPACYTEEDVEFGWFSLRPRIAIHSYQELVARSVCYNGVRSREFCQGMVYTGVKHPWITFFNMGYWTDTYGRQLMSLHLVEGDIKMESRMFIGKYGPNLYFYGFATNNFYTTRKLVDLASNQTDIGVPKPTKLLLYFYNPGSFRLNPIVRPRLISPKLQRTLIQQLQEKMKEQKECPFLKEEIQ